MKEEYGDEETVKFSVGSGNNNQELLGIIRKIDEVNQKRLNRVELETTKE